ncbi:hypothetical protein CsSME_00052686 [Camellia sinensis var. sinensis]
MVSIKKIVAIGHGVWHLMTFKSINSVMEQGVIKQLDFEDLLQLPNDMDPSSSLNTLLSSWQTQQRNNCSHPSFFRAIFTAYGWPYLRLGALKRHYMGRVSGKMYAREKVIENERGGRKSD